MKTYLKHMRAVVRGICSLMILACIVIAGFIVRDLLRGTHDYPWFALPGTFLGAAMSFAFNRVFVAMTAYDSAEMP